MVEDLDTLPADAPRLPVVGIGASAGGIIALQKFFDALGDDVGAAFVVVVHLDPAHSSELPAILQSHTRMRVLQVNDPAPLAPNIVYVIPPNRRLLVSGESVATGPFDEPRGQRAPIDLFFRSLAEHHGDGYAVVLSGGGADGAIGARAIQEKGGIVLVQDPNEAEFPSMPRNALEGGADFVLPVADLARTLAGLIRARGHLSVYAHNDEGDEDFLRRILAHLRSRTGQDFSGYKRATLMRRIARRMQVTHTERMDQYLAYLRDHAEEVHALFNDLLISVTSFFRDPEAYVALARHVIPRLFDHQPRENAVRVWVPACATGEEAYSIAMLLLEEAARREMRPDIQIFATDIDEAALAIAREGRYPAAIAVDVSEERLRRFFAREGDQYRIRREVRDLVVFASHSILKDPPFSHINLISCRNLLIYLDRDLQQQVVSILHYSVLGKGYLFLGTSESADNPPGLFAPVDRDSHIYRAIDRPRDRLPALPRLFTSVRLPELPGVPRPPRTQSAVDSSLHREALEYLAPPSLLVDEGHLIVNLSETCGKFLLLPSGPMTNDAAEIVRPELRLELRAALHRAFESNEPTVSLPIPVRFNGAPKAVVLHVRPVKRDDAPRAALVMFIEGGAAEPVAPAGAEGGEQSRVVAQLREELHATRTVLRTTREQYEAATEELRAANEELQSINEEYRSTAEELETSKEELQSINEELQTLNNELKLKLEMVSRAHNDLQNLMAATDVSTMFLDSSLRIERFTPRIAELFNIVQGDEGRPVTDFTHRLEYQDLVADAQRVLADLIPIERTVRTVAGRWFLLRLRPYRTIDDKIEGVVATFVDATEHREAEAAWEARQQGLLKEIADRAECTLEVVRMLASHTLGDGRATPDALKALLSGLDALLETNRLLVESDWRGAAVDAIARRLLAAHGAEFMKATQLAGPSVLVAPRVAMALALVLQSLSQTAVEHRTEGHNAQVEVRWQTRTMENGAQLLELKWTERGGAAAPDYAAASAAFSVIEQAVKGSSARSSCDAGEFHCSIALPLTS
ncbi:chemotaxis protein CheB [Methylocystis sp. JR02]|uniref:chemotaxis protein CheB n=1 Tax=Methylocystis sp. JR02 TaxID=3046284 RepID=UPI0024BB7176|nr:chemotaxis protein CheB [Methylocystis sp. JR02]MDJ0450693.1 chemotaxis protein CheB [Methylocystis sp. JR02]